MPEIIRQLLKDWDGDGDADPADPYEDVTDDILQTKPVKMRYGRKQNLELSPTWAGSLVDTLDNQHLRYADDYVSSPLFGLILPGRLVIAKATYAAQPQGYRQTVLNDAPAGYWRLGEASGTSAADESGNGNTGTYTGGVTLGQAGALAAELDGTSDTAALFDGATGYVTMGDIAAFRFGTNVILEAWVTTTSADASVRTIISRWQPGVARTYWLGKLDATNLTFQVNDGVLRQASASLSLVNDGQPHHVAGVADVANSLIRLYVDGIQRATAPYSGTMSSGAGPPLLIGADFTGGVAANFWAGKIDEPAVGGTTLSAARIAAHHAAGLDQANSDTSSQTHRHFTGYLQQPAEHPLRSDKNVSFTSLDALGRFQAQDVETAMYTNIRTDVALGHVADALGWPALKRRFSVGQTTMARWLATGVKGFRAIEEIVLSEGPPAICYVDPDTEDLVFEDRHFRLEEDRCTESQAVIRDTGTEPCYSRYDPKRSADNIVNSVTLQVKSWASTAGQALLVGGPTLPLALPPGGTARFEVATTADAFDAATPSVTASTGSAVGALNRTSGRKATLTVTAGVGGATVSAVSVTATTWTATPVEVRNSVDASASIDKYGERTLPDEFKPPWLPSTGVAVNHADYVVSRYQEKVPQNTVALNNYTAQRLIQALTRAPSDRITLIESTTGAEDDYFVEQVERSWLPGGNYEAALGCERAADQAYWVLGVPGFSELGVSTRLVY